MATIGSLSPGFTFTGLASGIDTSAIVEGLTRLNQQRIDQLQARKDGVILRQTTFGALEAALLDLQIQVGRMAKSVSGAFDGRTTSSSDDSVLTAAASAGALPGQYTLQVEQLAQAHQIASSGLGDPAATIKQGTVQIQVGGAVATTVTIDSTNNTLQGLATAINGAGSDIRATIVNDGSAAPYRLLLTSGKTGAANTIQVTNNLTTGDGAAIDLTQATLQAAGDARVTLGTGAGALTVTSAANQVNGLIAGVTVNLGKAAPGQPVTLTIAADTAGAHGAIKDFVASYNAVIDFIDERDNFDAKANQAGILLGNRDATSLQNDLAAALTVAVPGVNARANRLTAIGVSFTDDRHLQLDEAKLTQALTGQVPGVSLTDFRRLFGLTGESTSAGVTFVLGSDRTRPTQGTPYQVNVTQAATTAQLTATDALAPSVVINGTNNSLTIKVNGVTSALITLDAGTYTPADLAAALQAKINADSTLAGNRVAVGLDAGKLQLRSLLLGSSSLLAFAGGTALGPGGPLGLIGTELGSGINVAGQFLVNGAVESATGNGQLLIGQNGNTNTDGLQVRVTLGQGQLVAGPEADLTVTQGLASRLSQVLDRYLDPVNGRFKVIDDTFRTSADDIDKSIARQNDALARQTDFLVAQFAAMESTIARLKALGDQLALQLAPPTRATSR